MKRFFSILMIFIMSLSMCSCGNEEKEPVQETVSNTWIETEEVVEKKSNEGIEVDENLLSVEITLPATYFEDMTPEEIKVSAEENGISECIVNEDGSVIYKMSKKKHKEMLEKFENRYREQYAPVLGGVL